VIIDFHTHIVPPSIKAREHYLLPQDPCFQSLYSNPKAQFTTAEDLIESMDRDGIDISVALGIGWADDGLVRETNDYLMDSVNRYPARIVGFCSIHPAAKDALTEIERCAKGGLRGVGEIMPHIHRFDLGNKDLMSPIVEAAGRNNMVLLVHSSEPVGHIYPGKGDVLPGMLYQFVTNFPDARIVCAHWGGGLPFYGLMPEVLKALEHVWFDTAASPFLYKYDVFGHVASIIGEEKILFGSDYPLITQKRIIDGLEKVDLPQQTRRKILGENARLLLGL